MSVLGKREKTVLSMYFLTSMHNFILQAFLLALGIFNSIGIMLVSGSLNDKTTSCSHVLAVMVRIVDKRLKYSTGL